MASLSPVIGHGVSDLNKKSVPGPPGREGNGTPLQCSFLENPMDSGAWEAAVHSHKELDTSEVTMHARTLFCVDFCFFYIEM